MSKKTTTAIVRLGKPRSYWFSGLEKKIEAAGLIGLTKSAVLGASKESSYLLRVEVVGELLEKGKILYVGAKDWKGRSRSIRFLHRLVLLKFLKEEPQSSALDLAQLHRCYEQLVMSSGFRDVRINDLARIGSFSIVDLLQFLRGLHQQGKAELSRGDWSLASHDEKNASIEWQGQYYLRVKLKI